MKNKICSAIMSVSLLVPQLALAQGDGPRTYMLVPKDTHIVSQFYIHLEGNQTANANQLIPNGDIDVDLLVSMYTQTFELNGKQGAFFGILPYGKMEGSLSAGGSSISGSASGVGDLVLGGIFGLINSPNLSAQDYATKATTPNLGVLLKVTLPTGVYSSSKSLNMGANRWAFQVGFPMATYIGTSMVDPNLTSFELTPSATVFSDNTNPGGGVSSTSQSVLYKLEAHITHNFGHKFWASLDAEKIYGGETSTNGVKNNDVQNSFAVGMTVNYSFTPANFLKVTYGKTVQSNTTGADGSMLRVQFSHLF